jgi:membrane protein required for beta-lactamase induction
MSGSDPAVTLAIYAALTYDIISATNSSPQTTELNAAARAETLMKWVKLGLAQAALFALIGVAIEVARKQPIWPPLLGAGVAGGLLWVQYIHARNSGVNSTLAPTEHYG